MSAKIGFVLIPGGGMSDWLWDKVKGKLNLPFITINQRIIENTYHARIKSTLADCVENITHKIEKAAFDKCIIVGHSGAGALAANVCIQAPTKIVHAIFVAANIPKQGNTMMDSLPILIRYLNIIAIKKMIKKDSFPYSKIEKTLRDKFYNTCNEETIQYILKQNMLAEPICVIKARMDWKKYPPLPQTYMILLKDHTITISKQKEMAKNLNVIDFIEIESDHMVMLSHPEEFANSLNVIVSRQPGFPTFDKCFFLSSAKENAG